MSKSKKWRSRNREGANPSEVELKMQSNKEIRVKFKYSV